MLVVVRAKVTKTRAGAASATYRNMIVCVCVCRHEFVEGRLFAEVA